ncbi:MAG: TAXI family TRAP transporter solute-binding subunit [Inquilinus sp.]|nr:TAXI family TRAP transporter solute-binding subunit [Inquilinus sp.]
MRIRGLKATVLASLAGLALAAGAVSAQDLTFFTIGTGGTGATYYPLGGVIANAVSNPPGSRPCDEGGSCGVPGLIAVAQSSRGSVNNVNGINSGLFNSGFSQSDVAYWAYTGTGVFDGQDPMTGLRAIAALYPEHIHLVARADAGIETVADLRGKRVSLDEPGSGTFVDALIILSAYGLTTEDMSVDYLKPGPAGDALRNGQLDAFFIVAGYPTGAVVELASSADVTLVPLADAETAKMVDEYGFFSNDAIPAGTYEGIGETATLAVGAQWITSIEQDEELIYGITAALWNDKTRRLLDVGHAKGASVRTETALDGIGIPLHPGAERFYREAGLL